MLRSRVGNTLWRLGLYREHRFRAVSRELFYRVAGRFTPELIAESDGMRFRVPTYDRAVGLMSFASGPPERETMKLALALLAARGRAAEGGRFLDIGANIGTATVTAFREGLGSALCFEPLPDNHRLLLENLAENDLSARAETLNLALSDSDGEADFEVSPNNSGDGRVRIGGAPDPGSDDAFGESTRTTLKVPLAKLDTLCEQGAVDLGNVSLAWIDAQGHEGQILTGATKLLRSKIPLVTEVWPYGLKRSGGREAFVAAIRDNFELMIDLDEQADGKPGEYDPREIDALLGRYEKSSFFDPGGAKASTDLLLL